MKGKYVGSGIKSSRVKIIEPAAGRPVEVVDSDVWTRFHSLIAGIDETYVRSQGTTREQVTTNLTALARGYGAKVCLSRIDRYMGHAETLQVPHDEREAWALVAVSRSYEQEQVTNKP